ncbi:MAG: Rhodanese domain protein [Parcubacteria group bacterium GW2011_GWC2_42_6]|nr:MAG: Rhodanese domain protein [Parcubacteria group bacterium GW2011_GWA2_42_11]KKS67680.1 MAG: Rhodanese domain protein [Parcubacteria group bacterium GW2011_GWC2_42_6]KKT76437.1 MAG: Rhodanese domain protein [Parcubacteria group bacterium GW2011_GWF2_44_7]
MGKNKNMPVENISAENLRKILRNKKAAVELIDVREPDEYQFMRIKGSKLIPMGELVSRLDEINWDKEVVFICRSGSRSALMADLAASLAKKNIKNLQYGIYECFKDGRGEFLEGEFLAGDKESAANYF